MGTKMAVMEVLNAFNEVRHEGQLETCIQLDVVIAKDILYCKTKES